MTIDRTVKLQSTTRLPRHGATEAAPPGLTREAIVSAALAQIDRDGLEAFSLRNLARALGVYPTALYWHVPGRNALLADVLALVISPIAPGDGVSGWQDTLRRLMSNCRAAIRRHPNVAPLLGAQLVSNIGANLALVEGVLDALAQAGFAGPRLVAAYNAVIAAMVGFTTQEFAPMPEDAASWQQAMRARLGSLPAGRYPLLSANLPMLANRAFILRWQNGVEAPLDEGFEMFVDVVIRGLEALAATPPSL